LEKLELARNIRVQTKKSQTARRLVRRSGRQRLLWRKLVAVLAAPPRTRIIIVISGAFFIFRLALF
jgi:hypothetical protein